MIDKLTLTIGVLLKESDEVFRWNTEWRGLTKIAAGLIAVLWIALVIVFLWIPLWILYILSWLLLPGSKFEKMKNKLDGL